MRVRASVLPSYVSTQINMFVLTECSFYIDLRSDLHECWKRVCENLIMMKKLNSLLSDPNVAKLRAKICYSVLKRYRDCRYSF